MNRKQIRQIIRDTDYIHTSASPEELKTAEYLKNACETMGVSANLEEFSVPVTEIKEAELYIDGEAIPCTGYRCCGSWDVEAPLVYLPNTDAASLALARGKIVLLDQRFSYFVYHDLFNAGIKGIITYTGSRFYADHDIDTLELRSYVAEGKLLPCMNINAKDAFKVVKSGAKSARIHLVQNESTGMSHNVVATLPGTTDEWVAVTAHYDTTPLSRGNYDNMTGAIALLLIMEQLKAVPLRRGLRFIFCGSEERGLLGSKAYVRDHAEELKTCTVNVNIDMIGSVMGKFIACCSATEATVAYIKAICLEQGWGMEARQGVYSSDSTPFADAGVPGISFARLAPASQAIIHTRFDTPDVLSDEQIAKDAAFITSYVAIMADSVVCPVEKVIPDKVKTQLDEYLNRKRKE